MCKVISPEQICSEFESFGIDLKNEVIIDKVQEFCQLYKFDAEGIVETWLAFSTSHQLDSQPTLDNLVRLENEELTKKKIKAKATLLSTPKNKIYNASNIDELIGDVDDLMEAYCTPDIQASKKRQHTPDSGVVNKKFGSRKNFASPSPVFASPQSILSSTPSSRYVSRSNVGDVVLEFGSRNAGRELVWENRSDWRYPVKLHEDSEICALTKPYRYMYEKLRCLQAILNDRIEATELMIKEKLSLEELVHIRMPSAKPVDVVGRICCDSVGKLNRESILLECSHDTSTGATIPLDVSGLDSFSFFPGQIVALSGINPLGKKFFAQKMYDPIFPPLPSTTINFNDTEDPVQIIVSAGPYTTSDTLSFEPMQDFLKIVQNKKPHVCIMIGPFLEDKNKEIEVTQFEDSFEDIFTNCISMIADAASKSTNTEFVIVPSLRDVHHHFIYPTPPYSCPTNFPKSENLQFVSDPSLLNISGMLIGVTSTDVIFHLGKEEISFPAGMPDRLGRFTSHLLSQQSFYPLYPPVEEMNISYEKLDEHGQIPVTPHILLLPSDLNCFAKDIKGCCCINPQRLTRGVGGGTYCRLQILPNPLPQAGSSLIPNINCDVVRI